MKFTFQKCAVKCLLLYTATLTVNIIWAQACPPTVTTGVAFINNTYFPGQQAVGGGAGDNNDGTGTPNGGFTYKEEMLDISPVPAKRYTMIKWSATTSSKLTITMFDATGRFVLCRQYQLRKGINELLLTNLEAHPAGVYCIKASDGTSYRNGKLRIQQ